MRDDDVRSVQQWYPQIYLACHTRHPRAASSGVRLSGHDSSVLAHLDTREPMTAGRLARHLRVGASTLSATVQRLVRLGYIVRTRAERDARIADLRLTTAGARAMRASSVLDDARVAAVLGELSAEERRRALDGLSLLARASRALASRGAAPPPASTAPPASAGSRGTAGTEASAAPRASAASRASATPRVSAASRGAAALPAPAALRASAASPASTPLPASRASAALRASDASRGPAALAGPRVSAASPQTTARSTSRSTSKSTSKSASSAAPARRRPRSSSR